MTETETVEVSLKLPKPITEYIKESWHTDNLSETITKEVADLCVSQVEADANEKGAKPLELMKKYELLPIFKQLGVLPGYYKNSELEVSDLKLITVKIELCKPFYDFIEEYRRYFGSQYTTEQICMVMIYSQVKRLFNELDGFARKKGSFLDKSDFFKKNFYLGTVSFDDPEEETLCTVRFDAPEDETEI